MHRTVSGQLSEPAAWKRAAPRGSVSCCLSATGIGFLGHPVPAEQFSLPHGRPTRNILDLGGVSTFHMRKTRPGRVPPQSRGGGVLATG